MSSFIIGHGGAAWGGVALGGDDGGDVARFVAVRMVRRGLRETATVRR
ncbi:hypothetical protein [Prauserella alba]|nr:hypothetical protein [Prauserella alba]